MERMTHKRVNGIKTGYWSPATKEELVQRLAEYENTGLEPQEIAPGHREGGQGRRERDRDQNGRVHRRRHQGHGRRNSPGS